MNLKAREKQEISLNAHLNTLVCTGQVTLWRFVFFAPDINDLLDMKQAETTMLCSELNDETPN